MEESDWIASMEERIRQPPQLLRKSAGKELCCIFRAPQSLVDINEKAYQPRIVSIGPYHHGKERLQMIEEHKRRFLHDLLERMNNYGMGLAQFCAAIASKEEEIRGCYAEEIKFGCRELVEMMVLDGCFILELFRKVARLVPVDLDDPIFNMAWVLPFLMRDLLRLENQIPYTVLKTLFELSTPSSGRSVAFDLNRLALEFFNYAAQHPTSVLYKYYRIGDVRHLLDLFRRSYIPESSKVETPGKSGCLVQAVPSVRKLHVAGIQFKPGKSQTFLDIKFRKGVLQIPPLTIDDLTSSVFLNCVAFEQCYSYCTKHFTSYATFMACLINTPGDAGFLCDHKIIENYFGTDEEVAHFFNSVGKDVAFDIHMSYLLSLFQDVNEYYRNHWHVRWAQFKHTYFGSPWSFMSAFAALLLLLLTMIQGFMALYAYVKPPSP